jgi:hypothetical protein
MTEESATAVCRHEGCGKRFELSRYGNRTTTSERRRKGRHLFCSDAHRKAHARRLAAIRGGRTPLGGAIPKGGRTQAQNHDTVTSKINDLAPPFEALKNDLRPRFWLGIYFEDEAPAIGSGFRLVAVDRATPTWVRIRDHAGRTARLDDATWATLLKQRRVERLGHSAAMEQYEDRFPDAAEAEDQAPPG